jgi:hypothetical protein
LLFIIILTLNIIILKTAILSIIALFSFNLFFAQETCSSSDIENYLKEYIPKSEKKEKENGKKFDQAIEQYSKLKKWSEKQSSSYMVKLISDESYLISINKKQEMSSECMELLKKVDGKNASKKNCEIFSQIKNKYEGMAEINNADWQKIIQQVAQDYKLIAKKDIQLSE